MMQVPASFNATLLPLSVQTLVLNELNVSGFPESPPAALTEYVLPTTPGSGGAEVNVIAWTS